MYKRQYNILKIYNFRRNSIDITLIVQLLFKNTFGYISLKKNIFSFFYKNKFEYNLNEYISKTYIKMCLGQLEEHYLKNRDMKNEILIIPGGSNDFKKYSLEKYLEIAEYYSDKFEIGIILGKDMKDEIDLFKKYENKYNLYIGLELKKLEEIIKKSKLVIANDCGPSHFAHIYDIPRISLFIGGDTHKHWFNPTKNSVLIQSIDKDINKISIEKVLELADKLLV